MLNQKEFYAHFIHALDHLLAESESSDRDEKLYQLISRLFVSVCSGESLYFSTLFAMISYVTARYQVEKKLRYHLHGFRRAVEQRPVSKDPLDRTLWENAALAILLVAGRVLDQDVPADIRGKLPQHLTSLRQVESGRKFVRHTRVLAYAREANDLLKVYDEAVPGEFHLAFNETGRNDLYFENICQLIDKVGFPFMLSLVDIEIDGTGTYHPRTIVVEPDFLIDITAIANCFQTYSYEARAYGLNKFIRTPVNPAIMQGHISNYFLDELIHHPEAEFADVFPSVFKLNPLAFALFDDETVLKIMGKARAHFANLKNTIKNEWPAHGIDRENSILEPSFYSAVYGIQGRLDVFHQAESATDIIELKSGKPFMPNAYGLNQNHYAQTLLYDLLIKSVRNFRVDTRNYILYSNEQQRTLRFAPAIDSIQREAIKLRNELFLIEKEFAALGPGASDTFLDNLNLSAFKRIGGFLKRDIELFEKIFNQLSPLEKKYLKAFTGFIAREHHLAKTGVHGMDTRNGLASLWLDSLPEKEEKFNIFQDLSIVDIDRTEALITLKRGTATNPLGNFRVGDISVLYPYLPTAQPVLRTQIYKCTLIAIEEARIVIKLRNKQVNYAEIETHQSWRLEHDLLDSSFAGQYRSLLDFMKSPKDRRNKFLGIRPPAKPENQEHKNLPEYLNSGQKEIFSRMLCARDYFLLWGPPGTGKTSLLLRGLVEYHLAHRPTRILLLAYTNRAVDEMCAAIEQIGPQLRDNYFRIGSRVSTHPSFRPQLLDNKIRDITNRKALVKLIRDHRIVVSTVSSLLGRQELFEIADFEMAVVDEASQILEPSLSGLLMHFSRYILIGDHKQLPAVVTQSKRDSQLEDPDLAAIELTDMRDSYFERLYRLAQKNKWDWVTGALQQQGRMHADIMDFPSTHFYAGQLDVIPSSILFRDLQAPLELAIPKDASPRMRALARRRMVFIPTPADQASLLSKTSDPEAREVQRVLHALQTLYGSNREQLDLGRIGIITPFRAQIANIRETLLSAGQSIEGLTIDTVERYQGGARDIVILSLSVSHVGQLEAVISLSSEGVDRKLNVALTRAREQFILVADPEVLQRNELYRALMAHCFHVMPEKTPVSAG